MSKLGLFSGFGKVIIHFIWPYSCWFCRICWAYADWGLLFLMYLMCSWKRMFRLGSFGLRTPGCIRCMSVDKIPIYCGAECCGLLKV